MDAPGLIFIGRSLQGKLTTVSFSLHLWMMALTVVRWSPEGSEMAQ